MSSDSLENEDLANVPLVRMEDVQPSRNRGLSSRTPSKEDDEVYETCIIDDIEYENECVVNDDDDSNIGSMVSLQSGEVYDEESSSQELIIPEVLEQVQAQNDDDIEILIVSEQQDNSIDSYIENPLENALDSGVKLDSLNSTGSCLASTVNTEEDSCSAVEKEEYKVNSKEFLLHAPLKLISQPPIEIEVPPTKVKRVEQLVIKPSTESWPTLEILPGGVIKNTDKYETDSYLYPDKVQETVANTGEMMYACAKCSQTFKYLFCLVKHVKWHEDQTKSLKDPKFGKLKDSSDYICLHSGKKKIVEALRNKRKGTKRLKS